MGFMQNVRENMTAVHTEQVSRNYRPKDGRTHVLMLMTFSKIVNQTFGCDDKYTNEVDAVLVDLQNKGYEIVDIKLGVLPNQGITGQREGYLTCIMYR